MRELGWSRRAWKIGVPAGVVFGAGMAGASVFIDPPGPPWWVVLVIAVVAGIGFGATVGVLTARQERVLYGVAGEDLTWREFRAAARASRSRRTPQDPRVRAAALRIAVYQEKKNAGLRWVLVGFAVAAPILLTGGILAGRPVTMVAGGMSALVAIVCYVEHVHRRKAILRLGSRP